MPRAPRLPESLRVAGVAILLGAVGFLFNLFPVSSWNGTYIFGGGIAVAASALRFGPWAGLLTAAIAWLPTLTILEQPLVYSLALVEPVLLGRRRTQSPPRQYGVVVGWWLLVAGPILAIWYLGYRGLSPSATAIIVVKNVLNATAALGVAKIYVGSSPLHGRAAVDSESHISLRSYLLRTTAMGVTLPAIIALFVVVRLLQENNEEEQARRMRGMALSVVAALDDAMSERASTIEILARSLSGQPVLREGAVAKAMVDAGPGAPSFITMLVADAEGTLIGRYPSSPEIREEDRRLRRSVADREYFRGAKETGRRYVSDIFVGRTVGSDRIIAVSAPIVDDQGRFQGVVEGSLAAARLGAVIGGAVQSQFDLTVISPSGTIIYGRDSVRSPVMGQVMNVWPRLIYSVPYADGDTALTQISRERRDEPSAPIAEQTHLVATAATQLGWTVRVERSLLDIDAETRTIANLILLLTVTAFLLLRLLSLRLLRDVLDPLERIRLAVRPERFRSDEPGGERLEATMPALAPRELIELSQHLDALRDELQRNFGALQRALHDGEVANAKLAAATVGLEATVAQRTQALVRSVEEAQAAARAKAEFLAKMSHELRTPLNAVIGSIDALREGVHGPVREEQLSALAEMEHGAQHLLSMIGDILDMERLATGRLQVRRERVDVQRVLDAVRSLVAPLLQRAQLTWREELPSGALWIDADALRLQQVLLNLCGNAIKFSPPGGEVRVRVTTGAIPGRVAQIQVIDQGIGIPQEKLEEIFAPFKQVSHGDARRYEGSGLGLTIARGLCEAMGLSLTVTSTPGQGAVFSVAMK